MFLSNTHESTGHGYEPNGHFELNFMFANMLGELKVRQEYADIKAEHRDDYHMMTELGLSLKHEQERAERNDRPGRANLYRDLLTKHTEWVDSYFKHNYKALEYYHTRTH